MSMRRFTRLTNAFSKKVRNHAAAVALDTLYYNFARPHRSDYWPLTAEYGIEEPTLDCFSPGSRPPAQTNPPGRCKGPKLRLLCFEPLRCTRHHPCHCA